PTPLISLPFRRVYWYLSLRDLRSFPTRRSSDLVAGALELLEDDVVHPAAGVDDGRGHDRERAALLDVPRRREEAPRTLQRVGVETARQDLARRRDDGVVGAREARERVEQDHDIPLVLDQPLGLLDHHVGDLDVPLGRLVEGGRDHLALDGP